MKKLHRTPEAETSSYLAQPFRATELEFGNWMGDSDGMPKICLKSFTPPQAFGSPGTNSKSFGRFMVHSRFGKHDPSDGNKSYEIDLSRSSLYFVNSSCPAQPSFLSLPRLAGVVGYRSSAEAQETRAGFHRKE